MPITTQMPWHGLRGWLLRLLFRIVFRTFAWPGFDSALLHQRRRCLRLCFRLYLGQITYAGHKPMRFLA